MSAQLVGPRVRIIVSDTGPGLHAAVPDNIVSTGVGMANTRERLAQAYGDNHHFETMSRPTGGFEVMIEIPYEPAPEPVHKARERGGKIAAQGKAMAPPDATGVRDQNGDSMEGILTA